jgi:1-acyl-sn-glycerol-3-phosphate acyltransferase
VQASGLEKFPRHGPALMVINHLGDADIPVLLATLPGTPEAIGKIELHDDPRVGRIMDWYGIIWLHRGKPDKRALRAALQGLQEGRILGVAPEGRQTLAGGLEQGLSGAAFLALRTGASIVPIALTGTQNVHVYGELRRWRRPTVTVRIGHGFVLERQADHHSALRTGTRQIMQAIAALLPEDYRGAYQ